MIKDKIIELNNGINYYILEEISYENKKYVFAVECNPENDTVNKERYIVSEIKLDGTNLITANIEDDNLAKVVTKMLLDKIKNNN